MFLYRVCQENTREHDAHSETSMNPASQRLAIARPVRHPPHHLTSSFRDHPCPGLGCQELIAFRLCYRPRYQPKIGDQRSLAHFTGRFCLTTGMKCCTYVHDMSLKLTTAEAAKAVGIARHTLHLWIRTKRVKAPRAVLRNGRGVRLWSQADIAQLRRIKERTYRRGRGRKKKKKA